MNSKPSQRTGPRAAQITWRDGVPIADNFDDPYYSLAGGLEESRFVFLQGANIVERAVSRQRFVIGETGFGTGLNFLATWMEWRKRQHTGRLIFVSTEAHPLVPSDMEKAHDAFPEIHELALKLRDALPPPSDGFHVRNFDNGQVSLLLLIGDASRMFSKLDASIDAWFLDGFAPAKNPEMWSESLFQQIARLSKPGSTLATFTAAGFVRRGLAEVGFEMRKTPGYARKRERLVGEFVEHQTPAASQKPKWAVRPACIKGKRIGIIGGGIAGAALSTELKTRGFEPTIISTHHPQGCSDIPAAILAPRFVLDNSPERGFFSSAFSFAIESARDYDVFSSDLGVIYPPKSEADAIRHCRIEQTYDWGQRWLSLEENGLSLPKGGTVNSAKWLAGLTKDTPIINKSVNRIEETACGWLVLGDDGEEIADYDQVIIAAGAHSPSILRNSGLDYSVNSAVFPETRFVGGQIELVVTEALAKLDSRTHSFGNYVSASVNVEGEAVRSIGTTFDKYKNLQDFIANSPESRSLILDELIDQFGLKVSKEDCLQSWSGVRATTPDHLPYVGPIPQWTDLAKACAPMSVDANKEPMHTPAAENGLYILTGLGSKGFQYGPLLANYLAALIAGDPLPLPVDVIAKLHPGRGLVKHIVRQNK
ncbi:MAG: tRNA (5-methylaminomethyl-2-thiouridine)(34)-methyltransferase MnmD [Kordiimonadaceae bacterium]|nr:tRNA (5-methylaminomethyl-2-thiouridine)(34)-methyltransferase MnmD [Kordiimonadaceae bacterium]MBO6569981.1 tRNA (5-methylaminomethyl-2-thiouridine)(34)-methyltransferase MnmD [Kordiimonadaceae bacterium]MBO6965922.1 tRNA (5-methylaminomethyl-2-thiouridine)(34)-methyltransferase MnmD [Kordiimonadaceae bacterium]